MVIGLTGANASGKGEAADYIRSKGFILYSLSDILRDECKKKGLKESRENLILLGNELRTKNGPSILAERIIKNIKEGKDYIIDSIRNPFEIESLRRLDDFILIGIDAPIELRFERLAKRNRPGDPETLEDLVEKEQKENIDNSCNQQLDKCLELADIVLINDSTIEVFHRKIDEAISEDKKT
ncbi:MAG: AAA family ATPase [Candidatus Omnitrophota bacterium]